MSTSPSKRFGLKRSNEIRNISEFTKEEINEIKLTKCDENEYNNNSQKENNKEINTAESTLNDIPTNTKNEVLSV